MVDSNLEQRRLRAVERPGNFRLVSSMEECVGCTEKWHGRQYDTFLPWQATPRATYYYLWVSDASGQAIIQKWYKVGQVCLNSGSCSVVFSDGIDTRGLQMVDSNLE